MHKLLKLAHHRHTGKRLAHHHTSYRALFLLLAVVGAFMGLLHYTAQAADLEVTAAVPASAMNVAPTIDSPVNGTEVQTQNITLSGTCQFVIPTSIVGIYVGADLLGSTTCSTGGDYSLTVSLVPGTNVLVARPFNITYGYGPDSAPLTIIYTVPSSASGSSGGGPSGTTGNGTPATGGKKPVVRRFQPNTDALPLLLGSPNAFVVFGPGKAAEWVGSISGGKEPYSLAIDWGDDTTESHNNIGTETLNFQHRYKKMKTYFISIKITDAIGRSRTYQFAAVTPYISTSLQASPHTENGTLSARIFGIYLVVVGIWLLLWLDARHLRPQVVAVKQRRQTKKRRK